MSIDWLEDLENAISAGQEHYACSGIQPGEWHISRTAEDLCTKAQRTANAQKFPTNIYRLVNKMDTVSDDSYLFVRKFLDASAKGEPRFQWGLVDTRQAAEMMRDVSMGPSPYFGAIIEERIDPPEK